MHWLTLSKLALMAKAFIGLCKLPDKRVCYQEPDFMKLSSRKRERRIDKFLPSMNPNQKARHL
ncbi:hypothetical protein PDIG_73300 [Penicillium digitatum PHI26]|uniref:Uncharacterized protein n=2 Tax=Penicillium digitatum TaxID=36651 RepID=K9FE61_PEND2|nr:hypothetical protein PDIP_43780 [Penicillium digitatum Pd1]EKV07469.1 hypothetical protein PDIG_73300 [Penicillium digitatum PHI26]EKV14403.1 hypothetical protein PDIP_43780 [Penicillium digitatum Pd1]